MNVQINKIEEKLELRAYINPRTFDSVIEALEERVADLELKVSAPQNNHEHQFSKTMSLVSSENSVKIGEEVTKLKKIVKGLNEELKSGLRPLIDQMFVDLSNLNTLKG